MDNNIIYADITGIADGKYQDESGRKLSGAVRNMLGSGKNIILLYYSEARGLYITVSPEKFYGAVNSGEKISDSDGLAAVRADELEPDSVFLDLCSGSSAFPQRDWLLPVLINRDIRTALLTDDLRLFYHPEDLDDTEKMKAMYFFTAHLRCSEKMIFLSEEDAYEAEKFRNAAGIREKLVSVLAPDMTVKNISSDRLTAVYGGVPEGTGICSFLEMKEKDDFEHRPIKQMVFLSARPEPLLCTLPYIVRFMPFIKEIVVCCPDRMAEYLAKNYDLDLKLTVITDSQLLAGHELPQDHSTRNFFLRCLAMQRDELDDEFIMSDDDYRPLEEITEEVFFRDGKYISYYFIDLNDWQHTVAGIFSYDRSMFKTLEFLKKNGYPTYSFSAHQPQVINKKWYRRLIAENPDITDKGFDEWGTYFNYCAVHYRDHIVRKPYIVLGWPNVGTLWKHGVRTDTYLFENFYDENYGHDGVFYGMSPVFGKRTETENEVKRKMVFGITDDSESAYQLYDSFTAEYLDKYHEYPTFAVYCASDIPDRISISAPERYTMKAHVLNELRFHISRQDVSVCNCNNIIISASVHDGAGKEYFSVDRIVTPEEKETGCHMDPPVPEDPDAELTLDIKCTIENIGKSSSVSVPLVLVK